MCVTVSSIADINRSPVHLESTHPLSQPYSPAHQVARFLETQGLKEEALAIATDPDYRFELAIQLKKLDDAYKVIVVC